MSGRVAAAASTGVKAKPFVKWVGGKRQLLPELRKVLPERFRTLHEPFVGGGALFFDSAPKAAVLSDRNERLIRTYRGIRNEVEAVIRLLRRYPHDRAFFERLRQVPIDERPDAEVAAWFIYLNKTGYNGLYRVNGRNGFNVPFGSQRNPKICDEENLRACSALLQNAELHCDDFAGVSRRARKGDLVYFDPPYVPLSVTSSFTAYTAGGFGMEDQRRLRDVAKKLKKRGVHVIISNSAAPAVEELYGDGFELIPVRARRSVNSRATARGAVGEYLIL